MSATSMHQRPLRQLRILFWCTAIVLGIMQVWARRFEMNPDGMSYLDIGSAYFQGNWAVAINAYWSPLYSLWLGLMQWLVRPSPYLESTVAHLATFATFLLATWFFEFFLREVITSHKEFGGREVPLDEEGARLLETAWLCLGYVLFLFSSMEWFSLRFITPDLLMAAFLFGAAGLVLRIRRQPVGWGTHALLGLVLGLGFLAKTPMFFMALLFLAACALFPPPARAIPRTCLALVVFLAVAGPYIVTISKAKGRLTIGDSISKNLSIRLPWREQFGPASSLHFRKRVFTNPSVYVYEAPAGVTYPVWYDPADWRRDQLPPDSREREERPYWRWNLEGIYSMAKEQANLLVGLLALLLLWGNGWRGWKDIARNWPLLVPAWVGLAMMLLAYVQPRYVAGFFVVMWLGLFSAVRFPHEKWQRRCFFCIVVATALAMTPSVAKAFGSSLSLIVSSEPNEYWGVVRELNKMGLRPGDKIACVGYPKGAYWARLGGFRIVAEVEAGEESVFLTASPEIAEGVVQAIAGSGAKAIVSDIGPFPYSAVAWRRVGNTEYHVFMLPGGPQPVGNQGPTN